MNTKKNVTRRQFMQTATAGAATLSLSYLLIGCKGGSDAGGKEGAAAGGDKPAAADCTDISALSDADKATRSSLKYVDKSPDPKKNCANCSLFQPATGGGCGGCSVVKGPIAAEGYCTAWAPKA